MMKYFKLNNEVYAYDDEQLAIGYGKDMTPMTDEEVEVHTTPPKTVEQLLEEKISEAYAYLYSTAWYIERLNDPSSGKEVPEEILDGRANARLIINELEG